MWLAAGAVALIAALAIHGPPDPDMSVQMQIIAQDHIRWTAVHWLSAAALSVFAAAGLTKMSLGEETTRGFAIRTAWAGFALGALWTMTTAVAEATAVTTAAIAGNVAQFEAWQSFASGKASGFLALALAVTVIATKDSTSDQPVTKRWAGRAGAIFAAVSTAGGVLNFWFGVSVGGPIWLISSVLMLIWLCWFGIATARQHRPTVSPTTVAQK